MVDSVVQDIAKNVGKYFTELEGRSIAVSEVSPFSKSTMPTLPVAIVALLNEQGVQGKNGGRIEILQDVIVRFALKPVKYQLDNGGDSPFFAFYNYEPIRDRMLSIFQAYRTPRNGSISFKTLDVESDDFAVYLTFKFTVAEFWCQPEASAMVIGESKSGTPAFDINEVSFKMLQPVGICESEEQEIKIPCPQ